MSANPGYANGISAASAPGSSTATGPAEVVQAFLIACEEARLDDALALLAPDVVYTNVTLPTVHGRRAVERLFRPAYEKLHGGFRVHFHTIAADGDTVLTERTDELSLGRVRQRIWVYGRFEVHDGLITVWRDSFDWWDVLVGLLRGLAGAVMPALNRPWPGDA